MKARSLFTSLLLMGWFVLAAAVPAAHSDWYQGQEGRWVKHGKKWEWRGTHGDEWFEGHRGHWYALPNGRWYWLSDDGGQYRAMNGRWEWMHEKHHHHHHHH
jgi:hypothetical protein